jgi:hypothetical protein
MRDSPSITQASFCDAPTCSNTHTNSNTVYSEGKQEVIGGGMEWVEKGVGRKDG